MLETRNKLARCSLAALGALSAANGVVAATSEAPAVVELFTSQGCSSCPPADSLLGELAKRPDTIALSFHVDYWNGLGWPDHYSLPLAAERQRVYAKDLGLSSAFTPQAVVNGRVSIVGSDRAQLLAEITRPQVSIPMKLEISDGSLRVQLPAQRDHLRYEIYAAAYLAEATTHVGRGENSGRTLHEFHIVRQFRSLGSWDGRESTLSTRVDSFPADASEVAVLVQRDPQGQIAAGAKIALSDPGSVMFHRLTAATHR